MNQKELDKSKLVAYLHDNVFVQFVEPAGAEVIKADAKSYGCPVEEFDGYFNVVYTAVKKVASK